MVKTITGRIVSVRICNSEAKVEVKGGNRRVIHIDPGIVTSIEIGDVISWDEDENGKQIPLSRRN